MRTKPIPETAAFGIDIGKKVFHVVAVNTAGAVIQRAKFSRDTLMAFFDAAPKVLIGMEACPGSQWWRDGWLRWAMTHGSSLRAS